MLGRHACWSARSLDSELQKVSQCYSWPLDPRRLHASFGDREPLRADSKARRKVVNYYGVFALAAGIRDRVVPRSINADASPEAWPGAASGQGDSSCSSAQSAAELPSGLADTSRSGWETACLSCGLRRRALRVERWRGEQGDREPPQRCEHDVGRGRRPPLLLLKPRRRSVDRAPEGTFFLGGQRHRAGAPSPREVELQEGPE